MSATRDKAAREVMGTLDGGYQALVDALARAHPRARRRGRAQHRPVRRAGRRNGRALGVASTEFRPHDYVVTTLLRPECRPAGRRSPSAAGADHYRYLGVVCVVARLEGVVSPYYALNITDRRIPLTTVVETTHVIDPEHVGGHLLYVPKYVAPDNPDLDRPADEIKREYLDHVRTMFPALRAVGHHRLAARARPRRRADPHGRRVRPTAESLFPAPGLATASSAHIYPELVNGQAVLGVAETPIAGLLERVGQGQHAGAGRVSIAGPPHGGPAATVATTRRVALPTPPSASPC